MRSDQEMAEMDLPEFGEIALRCYKGPDSIGTS